MDSTDKENVVKEKDCEDITCISVRASSATFANCPKVALGMDEKMVTNGANCNYRTENTNFLNCT